MTRVLLLFMTLLVLEGCLHSQSSDPKLIPLVNLPESLNECSGLVDLGDNIFVGINDSGNPPELYTFSSGQNPKVRTTKVVGARNVDWEELALDDEYIYIGDVGNNNGNRKDLTVYRFRRAEMQNETVQDIEKIYISYEDQLIFKKAEEHNFDCEAMVVIGDSLYFFTKNRTDGMTNLYACPKLPGTYSMRKIDSHDAAGLITGAAYRNDAGSGQLALIGYTSKDQGHHPFILHFDGIQGTRFFDQIPRRLTFSGTEQTESICFADSTSVFIANEAGKADSPAALYKIFLKNPK